MNNQEQNNNLSNSNSQLGDNNQGNTTNIQNNISETITNPEALSQPQTNTNTPPIGINNGTQQNIVNPLMQPMDNTSHKQNIQNNNFNSEVSTNNGNSIPSSEPHKPIKLILLIIIISLILVSIGICYFVFFENNKNNDGIVTTTNSKKVASSKWDDFSLVIDGKTINLPMKFKDFISMGFYQQCGDQNYSQMEVDSKEYKSDSYRDEVQFTDGTTNNISISVYNPLDKQVTVSDSYIVRITFNEHQADSRLIPFTYGEIKVINNTKKKEAIASKSVFKDVEKDFGLHYYYDDGYSHVYAGSEFQLTYSPDKNSDNVVDMDELDSYHILLLPFDPETHIFDVFAYQRELTYTDCGNLGCGKD